MTWLEAVNRDRFDGERLGLRRLSLNVEVENLASQRLAERCGFRREGRLRSHQKLRDGTRADVRVYGLLAGDLGATRR